MNYDFKSCDEKLIGAKDWLGREYSGLRTGRASPMILDNVSVVAYGSQTPLKQVANVTIEDARTLRIMAWDTSIVKDIERAIVASNLGLGTVADGTGLRVTFPELTGERRIEMIKVAKAKLEDARATVRTIRDEIKKEILESEKEGGMGEDEKFRFLEELQKKVDGANEDLQKVFESKEKEMSA